MKILVSSFFILVALLVCFTQSEVTAASSKKHQLHHNNNHNIKAAPTGNLTLLADGFTWAENLWFDGFGGLWVTDDMAGKIYKLTRTNWTAPVTKTLWLEGFKNALGLQNVFGQPNLMLAVVKLPDGKCTSFDGKSSNTNGGALITFDINTPNNYTVAICTPVLGNGLSVNTANGKGTIYSANEGDFIPTKGIVFESNPRTEMSQTFDSNLDAADGVFLDQMTQTLYISEVLKGMIRVYNVSGGQKTFLNQYNGPSCKMIDDFCIAYTTPTGTNSSSPFMFAADFWNGNVVAFAADGSGPGTILATGLQSPTSVRQGRGVGWDNPRSVFVTEGGGFIPALQKNRRVWELHL